MKKWKIPVTWEMCGTVVCEAPTLEEAMRYAADEHNTIPLPQESGYIDGSWRLFIDIDDLETVRAFLNNGQADEVPIPKQKAKLVPVRKTVLR